MQVQLPGLKSSGKKTPELYVELLAITIYPVLVVNDPAVSTEDSLVILLLVADLDSTRWAVTIRRRLDDAKVFTGLKECGLS